MRKIAFIGQLLNDKTAAGIHRYTLELLKALDHIVNKNCIELIVPTYENFSLQFENIKVVQIGKKVKLPGILGIKIERYLYKNFYVSHYVKRYNLLSVDFLLQFPLFGCDVIAIHDCRVNKFQEFYSFSKDQKRVRRAMLRHQNRAVGKCKCIVTISDTAKSEIQEEYPEYNGPIPVIGCAWQHFMNVSTDETIISKLGLIPKSYFFLLGSRLPHKNIRWISYAAQKYPQYKFVVSGKSMGGNDFEGKQHSNVIFAGRLSDGEVKSLMQNCKAFIQPSLYEGFGLPPLEAMSVGADCLISDIPVFREIYKNSVWYFDPLDYEGIDLDKIMSHPKESNSFVLNEYSWEKSAKKLWDILQGLQ